jgi:hypothetical protein
VAVLTTTQVIPKYVTGDADVIGLFALKNVAGGDTVDLATLPAPTFQLIIKAVLITTSGFAAVVNFAGTVITMPAGMPAGSVGYLTVWGC